MKILSIESSCDETASAVIENGRTVLSSVISSQVEKHIIYGGVVPEIASRLHAENICYVVSEALSQANTHLNEIDAIAVTYAPGLIGALLVGVNFAKALSASANIPLVPVHHLRGHIAANYIAHPDLKPPFLCLVVSGGHTHLVKVNDYTNFEVIGFTRDDAAGEAFDKAGRAMGLSYPGGVNLDKIAEEGNPLAYKLPTPSVSGSPFDFSFSGLKTAVINLIHNAQQKNEDININDLSASFRKTVVDILTDKFIKAAEQTDCNTLVLAGGVSANRELRRRMTDICEKKGYKLYYPPLELCGDNGAMIGSQGYYEYLAGTRAGLDLNAKASLAIEQSYNQKL